MHGSSTRYRATILLAVGLTEVVGLAGCGLDTAREAPVVAGPATEGPCQGTEALIPRLLAFVEADRLRPVGAFIERRFIGTGGGPPPDPSLRGVAAAGLRVVSQLGLEDTGFLVQVAAAQEVEQGLGPWVSSFLAFIDGRIDGRSHYDASDAAAWFVARCDPDFLLTGIEQLLRLESPSEGVPWVVAALESVARLIDDPQLAPFLTSFEGLGGQGRPAVVELLKQIMTLIADPDFDPARIETLLQSTLYPNISGPLEDVTRRLVRLLFEATAPDSGVLEPLSGSLQCGLMHPEPRDVLLSTIYDLLVAPSVGVDGLLAGIDVLRAPVVAEQLDLLADALVIVRDDLDGRSDLRRAAVIALSTPDVQTLVPVAIDVLDEGIAAEVVNAFAHLLIICAEDS